MYKALVALLLSMTSCQSMRFADRQSQIIHSIWCGSNPNKCLLQAQQICKERPFKIVQSLYDGAYIEVTCAELPQIQ